MLTRNWTRLAVATLAALGLGASAATAGSITGTVTYEGSVPNLKSIRMDADPACAEKHKEPVKNEMLVLGEGNAMANIFVTVENPPEKDYPTPEEPVVMDQDGCQYIPHVLGIMVDQKFKILNSDGIMHNVHALPEVNSQFNIAMPPNRTEAIQTFNKVEGFFKIKCDVHPWMNAFVRVTKHPFYDVTEKDGKFEIKDLPAGTYTVSIWHEKLGKQTQEVTVGEGDTKTVDFKMAPPKS